MPGTQGSAFAKTQKRRKRRRRRKKNRGFAAGEAAFGRSTMRGFGWCGVRPASESRSRSQVKDCVFRMPGSDRSVLLARTSCSGVNRPRQSTSPASVRVRVWVLVAGQGERFSFRFADRGPGSNQRFLRWAPICEREPARGPSSGRARSGYRSWTKRSVLAREQSPDPDPEIPSLGPDLRKGARAWPVFGPRAIRLPVLDEKIRPGT